MLIGDLFTTFVYIADFMDISRRHTLISDKLFLGLVHRFLLGGLELVALLLAFGAHTPLSLGHCDLLVPVPPSEPVLQLHELSIVRGGFRILDKVSWTIERRQHWAMLGSNGSGKTSLLSAITGYLSPTGGDISVLGERFGASDWRDLRKHIGLVSSSVRQMMPDAEPALTTVLSGKYAMIEYWGRIKGEDRAAAARILRQIEAEHLAGRPWGVLSQGERQRILIGRALMAQPRLLILDEPCAGLDPVARETFLAFLERLCSKRSAPVVILVTHHVEEIIPALTHALLLRGGQVLAAGSKQDVLDSARLSETFGARVELAQAAGRYTLAFSGRRDVEKPFSLRSNVHFTKQ